MGNKDKLVASSTAVDLWTTPSPTALRFAQENCPFQPDIYGGLTELHKSLEHIFACLVEVKDRWTEGTAIEGYFGLRKLTHLILAECEKLKLLQSSPHYYRFPNRLAIWNVVQIVVSRCMVEAASPLKEYLSRLLDEAQPTTTYKFLHLLEGYDIVIDKLGHHKRLLCILRIALELAESIADTEKAREENKVQDSESGRAALRNAELTAYEAADLLKRHTDHLRSTAAQTDPDVDKVIKTADEIRRSWYSRSRNVHFTGRASANGYYIGQKEQLEEIRKAFEQSDSPVSAQKRFVIQGQPGSGKTEMALKYATEHRDQFWGVFWVDASSETNATQSFVEMAKIFGENLTEQAAKRHLGTRHPMHPWLLIIDNADDDDIILENLVPPGNIGHVLVTTRNPKKIDFGTVGQRGYLELGSMHEDDASDLLLTAAQYKAEARKDKVLKAARDICQKLYCLPLALVYAGKAIHYHALKLRDYMTYFHKEAALIRDRRRHRCLIEGRDSHDSSRVGRLDDDDEKMSVFASFELLTFSQLRTSAHNEERFRDAIQLLQIFAFLHFQNIRVDFLTQAALNSAREAIDRAKIQKQEKEIVQRMGLETHVSWTAGVQQGVQDMFNRLSPPPVLPDALKNPWNLDVDDLKGQVEIRVRGALQVLASRSLITRATRDDEAIKDDDDNDKVDMYTMHPLVQQWVRERPSLSVAGQALFCQYALSILSNSVRLVGGDEEEDVTFRRALKPHIEKAVGFAKAIEEHIGQNLKRGENDWCFTRWARWATQRWSGPWQAQMQIGQDARFAKVFLECGAYKEAEELLAGVHERLVNRLGPDHQLTNLAKLGLAKALLFQTRRKESTILLRQVYSSRRRTLGERHPQTLDITVELAEGVLALGRISESFGLGKQALDGLKQAYGQYHRKTIHCVDLIGNIQFFYNDYEACLSQHREVKRLVQENAEKGDEAVPEIEKLIYKEHLAGALMAVSRDSPEPERERLLAKADRLSEHVVTQRQQILGRSHPLTLWGQAQRGRIQAVRWREDPVRLVEIAKMMFKTLEKARTHLGDGHLGVLAGKKFYAEVLMLQGRLDEAEHYLRQASNKEDYAKASDIDGEHPDRIGHAWELVQCLERKGNFQEALSLCGELKVNILHVGGHGLGPSHRFNIRLLQKIETLSLLVQSNQFS